MKLTRELPQVPASSRKDLLRGSFAIVQWTDNDGRVSTRMVLQGYQPENRKLVYDLIFPGGKPFVLGAPLAGFVQQDTSGGSRLTEETERERQQRLAGG